ncbi:MAG: LysR substrate-binding domain-containing protein [Neisseria sp.]|nr:LysR substrate-binding domain-containing protein [Neisseria sp.]
MKKLSARKLPSITALQCFEAAARHLNFTKAAKELHMTQSAVSKQVIQLETLLDSSLFRRVRHSLQLTPTGNLFLRETQAVLEHLEQSVLNILAHGSEAEVVRIFTHPTFGARWLMPALKGFDRRYPHFHLEIHDQLGDFCNEFNSHMDIGFLHGSGVWPGLESIKLFNGHFVAVCAPDIPVPPLAEIGLSDEPVLIQSRARPRAWHDYFEYAGIEWEGIFSGARVDAFHTAIHAAEAGHGIALVPEVLVKNELAEGRLKTAWPQKLETPGAYYLVYPLNMEETPKIQALVQWIQQYTATWQQ